MEAKIWPAVSLQQARAALTATGTPFEIETVEIDGRPVKAWKNAPPTLAHVFLLSGMHASKDFLIHEHERATYADFRKAALTLAARLREDGVGSGDRVAIAMRNLPEWPVAFFATVLLGAIAVPLNAWWTGGELEYGLTDSGAKVLIVDGERWSRIAPHAPNCRELRTIYVSRAEGDLGSARRLEDVLGAVNAWRDLPDAVPVQADITPETPAAIFYTSGTTGKPKGALGTHRNSVHSFVSAMFSRATAYVRRGEAPPELDPTGPQKGVLVSIPFFHTTGFNAGLVPLMMVGGKVVMQRRFEPEEAYRLIERERLTNAGGVPAIAIALTEHPARASYELSSLESISYGGAPPPQALVRRLKEVFPHALPGTGWGMTETSATHTHHQGEDYLNRPGSCGPAMPVCEVKVIGPGGETLPVGEVGELCAYGPNIVRGYWNKPDDTASTFVDGWVRTGDLARIDDEGVVFIVDRAKDIIIRGGENNASAEVENALFDHPDVIDAAVVPRAHPLFGEEPVAVVTLREGASVDEAALKAHVRERLASFKVPAAIRFERDVLPRNANGTIVKTELRKLCEEA